MSGLRMRLEYSRLSPWLLAALGLTSLAACTSNGPRAPSRSDLGAPSVTQVAAPAPSDTIDTEPTTAYVLAVTNEDGSPVVGTAVTFRGANAEVAVPGEPFAPGATQRTDSRGEVAVVVRFGRIAGAAVIEANVPTIQTSDTLRLDVRPGNAVGPAISASDTTVTLGVPVRVQAVPVDRYGNAAGEQLPVAIESGVLSGDEGELVAHQVGTSVLAATFEQSTARLAVTVVPDGEVALTSGGTAWVARLDGSSRERLNLAVPGARERSLDWDRAGDRIVLGGRDGFTVFDLRTGRATLTSWPDGPGGADVIWPRFGPDGLVHFSASDGGGGWDIRRMATDGSEPVVTIPTDRFPNNDFFPDWDRDGHRFAFTADWEQRNRFLLRVANPGTTAITTVYVEGVTPVWSPDGSLIAYQEQGTVGVTSPDGTIHRSWNVGWSKGVTWSPDGRMLAGLDSGRVAILDVSSGEELHLPHLGLGIDAVAWRPRTGR